MLLKNLKVMITGGTSGLGLEMVGEFLNAECWVVFTGLSQDLVQKTISSFDNHPRLSGFVADITSLESLKNLKKSVGDLDILINNAGVYTVGVLEKTNPEDIQKVIQTNLIGTIFVVQTFLPIFKSKNKGTFANILSIRSNEPIAESSIYVASKFGLRGFFESLKLELAKTGIQIINFYPSGINTDLFKSAGVEDKDKSSLMDPREIAKIVVDNISRSDKTLIDHVVIQKPKR